jgi:predicted dehydrogenase
MSVPGDPAVRQSSLAKPSVALIGAGSMGANHARTIANSERATLGVVVDCEVGRAADLADIYGSRFSQDVEDALSCDIAVVATTAQTHLQVAGPLIEESIPVLVEKPLASDIDETRRLIGMSERHGTPMMCGFVERFNPVVIAARDQIAMEGPAIHIVGMRHSPPNPRAALSVVHDLLIHDADLVFALTGEVGPTEASGTTWRSPSTGFDEIADATVTLESGAIATVSASRMGQRKVREFRVATGSALFELDLLRRTLTVYRHVSQEALMFASGYRAETVVDIPFVRQEGEPLALQFRHFLALAAGEVDPKVERDSVLPSHEVVAKVEPIRHRLLSAQH